MSNKKNKELYWNWRAIQREQLGKSANLYMIFASAILGFAANFLIVKKNDIDCVSLVIVSIGGLFLLISLLFYGGFTHNRLKDFQKTAKEFNNGKTEQEVMSITKDIGELTWKLYDIQRYLLLFGFAFSLFGICLFIYS